MNAGTKPLITYFSQNHSEGLKTAGRPNGKYSEKVTMQQNFPRPGIGWVTQSSRIPHLPARQCFSQDKSHFVLPGAGQEACIIYVVSHTTDKAQMKRGRLSSWTLLFPSEKGRVISRRDRRKSLWMVPSAL